MQRAHATSGTLRDLVGSGNLRQQTSASCASKKSDRLPWKRKVYSQMPPSPKRGQMQVYPMKVSSTMPFITRTISLISPEYGQHGTTSSLLHNHCNPGAEMIMVIIIACAYANSILCGLDHFFSLSPADRQHLILFWV